MGNRVSDIKETRTVVAGIVNDVDKKRTNRVITSKYSLITFLPKNLLEQFRRLANFYFLIVTFISVVIDSPISPITSLLPLVFVIVVSMAKQGYEDWLRHRVDNTVNNELISVIRNSTLQQVKSHRLRPGDLVKISRDCDVPCDCVLLWSSDERGKCFVTTANLDGETSLKTLKVPSTLAKTNVGDVSTLDINIEVLPPEPDIYTFHGKLFTVRQKPMSIGTENLLLRGSRVKNTEWAIGCAIYTGKETKLALNSKFKSNKFTSSEGYVNNFLLFFIILMLVEIIFSFVLKLIFEDEDYGHQQYLGDIDSSLSFKSISQDIFSFLLLYYYCIPISLYVTIEMHKFIGSKFFEWDQDLYCYETNQTPLVNSSDLNEELGQVEILFSDKTGTLTKNDMYFQMCSVDGKLYMEKDSKLYEYCDEQSNESIAEPIETLNPDIEFFFKVLALCHTVQVEDESPLELNLKKSHLNGTGKPIIPKYQAMSSDEIAFVRAAFNRGIMFSGDDFNILSIKRNDGSVEKFEKLQTLEFTSVRRRMSIIVKDESGKIFLFCKGAESAILPLCLDSPLIAATNNHVELFAKMGLRTLAVAYKELNEESYRLIEDELTQSSTDIAKIRSKDTVDHLRIIENDLTLLGATGVEDRLQDNVIETMESLRTAGIKIWVLTGDKVETAVNVAQSCGHIPINAQKLFLTDVLTRDELLPQLCQCIEDAKVADQSHLTLVIDGQTLQLIFGIAEEKEFIEMSLSCKAVICCRLSPLQKAEVVKLVKRSSQKPITAAIGDGANDISMIQEAHVGFGIFGKEGRQAARSADFSFAKFDMIKKTLLVHGHWYYERFATLLQYSFYKNFVFSNLMFLFEFNTRFSTQTFFDSFFLSFFNLLFASAPILVISLTEKCHAEKELMSDPLLYKNQCRNKLLSWIYFFGWSALACYHSVIIYYFSYAIWQINPVIHLDGTPASLWCFGTIVFHCLVVVVNLKIWMHSRYQTLLFIFFTLITIFGFMGLSILYSALNFFEDGDMLGVYWKLLASPTFWFTNILVVVTSFQPDFFFMTFKQMHKWRSKKSMENLNVEMTRL